MSSYIKTEFMFLVRTSTTHHNIFVPIPSRQNISELCSVLLRRQSPKMCLIMPFSFSFKRKARSNDSNNHSIYGNYDSSSTGSSPSFLNSSSSSLGYLDPYDFASFSPTRHGRSSVTSVHAPLNNSNSAMDANDNFSTAASKDWASAWSSGSHQGSHDSFDLIQCSSVSSRSPQQPNSSKSRDILTRTDSNERDSLITEDSGYDACPDTNSIASQVSYASAIHGSMSEASLVSTDEVPNHPLRTQTFNAASEHFQNRRTVEQLRLAVLAVLRGSSANVYNALLRCVSLKEPKMPLSHPPPKLFVLPARMSTPTTLWIAMRRTLSPVHPVINKISPQLFPSPVSHSHHVTTKQKTPLMESLAPLSSASLITVALGC